MDVEDVDDDIDLFEAEEQGLLLPCQEGCDTYNSTQESRKKTQWHRPPTRCKPLPLPNSLPNTVPMHDIRKRAT